MRYKWWEFAVCTLLSMLVYTAGVIGTHALAQQPPPAINDLGTEPGEFKAPEGATLVKDLKNGWFAFWYQGHKFLAHQEGFQMTLVRIE